MSNIFLDNTEETITHLESSDLFAQEILKDLKEAYEVKILTQHVSKKEIRYDINPQTFGSNLKLYVKPEGVRLVLSLESDKVPFVWNEEIRNGKTVIGIASEIKKLGFKGFKILGGSFQFTAKLTKGTPDFANKIKKFKLALQADGVKRLSRLSVVETP